MMPLVLASLLLAQEQAPQVARVTSVVVKVIDRVQVSDAIVAKAETLGGYFTERSDDQVMLRVPHDKLAELVTFVDAQGVAIQHETSTQEMGAQVENYRAVIATREQLLQRYLDALTRANGDGVVAIEREATRLVQDIEAMKGALRLAEHQLAFAALRVSFQIRDRQAPARDGRSSFKWLNTVNLSDLIGAFQHEE